MNMKKELGKKIIVKYSLLVGDEKDHWHSGITGMFRAPENISALDLMNLAADLNKQE